MKRIQPIMSFLLVLTGSLSWGLAGTEEEIIRLQNDVLQLQNQIRLLQKSVDDTAAILKSLLEQLNDQMAISNVKQIKELRIDIRRVPALVIVTDRPKENCHVSFGSLAALPPNDSLTSAFPESGHSDHQILSEIRIR